MDLDCSAANGGSGGPNFNPLWEEQVRVDRDQGISKADNSKARAKMIELAWTWLRYQPDSALSRWFQARVGNLNRAQ